jgi:hypothetical protein
MRQRGYASDPARETQAVTEEPRSDERPWTPIATTRPGTTSRPVAAVSAPGDRS